MSTQTVKGGRKRVLDTGVLIQREEKDQDSRVARRLTLAVV